MTEPPLGPDAVYLLRVSLLKPDGTLTGPFGPYSNAEDVNIPHYGSFLDLNGRGIYGVVGNTHHRAFSIVNRLGADVVARRYRFQVISSLKDDIEPDRTHPFSRSTKRAWVIFTADEAHARMCMHILINKFPSATHEMSKERQWDRYPFGALKNDH
ncbi:hypothetical protein [Rhodobacter sp. SY28-1]|uniref:hypothetical protein n=1 Tax=Rhodobacter sp. SY28-1 TaxID=2562317 RepID=UPI001484CB42|nr:hypothetical protein [Rhodobacter sp. SY28-1]